MKAVLTRQCNGQWRVYIDFKFFDSGLKMGCFPQPPSMGCQENPRESHRTGTEMYGSRTCEEEVSIHYHKE